MKREKKLFIGCFNKSVILTYIGVIFALAGIFILIDLQEAEQMNLVMFCLIISGLCDCLMALLPENATEMKHKKLLEFRSIHYAILSHLLYFRRFFCIKWHFSIILRWYLRFLS